MKLTQQEKDKFLEIIKTVDLQELLIPNEADRKWFKFGAYDALRILAEKVLTNESTNR